MIEIIQTALNAIVAVLGGTALSVFLFYSAKRREAVAAAEEKAAAEKSFADEWQHLYEKKEQKVVALDAKVDELRREINTYREETMSLKDDMHKLRRELDDANYNRCIRRNCPERIPPRKEGAI